MSTGTTIDDDYYNLFDAALEAIYADGDAIFSIEHDLAAMGAHLSRPLSAEEVHALVHVSVRAVARATAIARLEQSMGFKVRIRPASS
jgi:hypothetical protein